MSEPVPPPITVQPRSATWIDDAVAAGGGELVADEAATGLIWTSPVHPEELAAFLADHPRIDWVQLPWAGVEPFRDVMTRDRTWSCAKGVYADPVAEHALALLLAGFRNLPAYARAQTWTADQGRNLFGARVVILGGGGIAEVLITLLAPFRCTVTVVRRTPVPMDGVDRVVAPSELHDALRGADALVLALPLLAETRQGKPPFRITADLATLTADRENVYFKGNVRAVREATPATAKEPASGPLTITTEFLHVLPSQEIVRTDKAVTITDPRGIINATGMEADSKAKTIKFKSGVRGHMEPRK